MKTKKLSTFGFFLIILLAPFITAILIVLLVCAVIIGVIYLAYLLLIEILSMFRKKRKPLEQKNNLTSARNKFAFIKKITENEKSI